MSKSRGNKTSKAARAERQARALQLMKEGKTQTAIAEELRISRQTFWRDLQAIEAHYVSGAEADIKQFKEAQYRALMKLEEATAKGIISPDVTNALTRIRDSVAKLLGLNAPTKSVSMSVSQSHDIGYLRFKAAVDGLTEAQVETVLAYATALVREPRATIKDASWFPAPEPQLLEGETENESA
jgi:biotin operon repressor